VTAYGPTWADGLYDGRLRIPVPEHLGSVEYSELAVVLRHELVHAVLALLSDSRSLPSWFNEGFAQRLSCQNQPCGKFQFPAQRGGFLPPDSFVNSYLALSAVNAGRAYQQSLFMVMTIEMLKGEGSLRQIVANMSTHSDITSEGLLAPLGLSFTALHAAATSAWQRGTLPTGG
jgi:hypothetical protein